MKSMYSSFLIDKQLKRFFRNRRFTQNHNKLKELKTYLYYKIPYKGSLSNSPKKKAADLCNVKRFLTIVFSSFDNSILGKYSPSGRKFSVVYKLVFVGCQSC